MEIRIATEKDANAIADIIKRHAQDDYMGYATFDERYVKDKMKRDIFIVAADNGIVGCVRISMVEMDLAEIRTMCVDADRRRSGIATSLMEKTFALLREKRMRKLVARTKADNAVAINFFRKFGFVQEGYLKEHYRKGIDIVQMAIFL